MDYVLCVNPYYYHRSKSAFEYHWKHSNEDEDLNMDSDWETESDSWIIGESDSEAELDIAKKSKSELDNSSYVSIGPERTFLSSSKQLQLKLYKTHEIENQISLEELIKNFQFYNL